MADRPQAKGTIGKQISVVVVQRDTTQHVLATSTQPGWVPRHMFPMKLSVSAILADAPLLIENFGSRAARVPRYPSSQRSIKIRPVHAEVGNGTGIVMGGPASDQKSQLPLSRLKLDI